MSDELVRRAKVYVVHVDGQEVNLGDRIEALEAANRGLVRLNEATEARAIAAESALAAAEAKVARLERALWAMLEHTADMDPLQGDDGRDPEAVKAARAALASVDGSQGEVTDG